VTAAAEEEEGSRVDAEVGNWAAGRLGRLIGLDMLCEIGRLGRMVGEEGRVLLRMVCGAGVRAWGLER